MLDCVGKELQIGDKVVCADRQYADLLIGEIIGFTPKKARVRYHRSEYGDAYGVHGQNEQLKESYQIFKYEEIQHGEWISTYMDMVCSVCGQTFSDELPMMYKFNYQEPRHCPNCGSIMDGGKQSDNKQTVNI